LSIAPGGRFICDFISCEITGTIVFTAEIWAENAIHGDCRTAGVVLAAVESDTGDGVGRLSR